MPEPKTLEKQPPAERSPGALLGACIAAVFFFILISVMDPSSTRAEGAGSEQALGSGSSLCGKDTLRFIYASERACRFYPIIHKAATRHEVETHLVMAIIYAESRYNPNAVSHRGARGLMQLMPRTAESLGVADSMDPVQNVDGGVRYLKWLLEHLDGDLELALAAYNAGLSNVRQHNGVPPFPATRSYIEIVSSLYERYKRREQALSAPSEVSSVASANW
jgi:hypothetical protein